VERHVRLLSILLRLWGALALLVGVALLLLAAGALAVLLGPDGGRVGFAAGFTATMFAVSGVFSLAWGTAHIWSGVRLKRLLPAARMVALALAVVNLLILPFGTALGGYALWVLMINDGRRLFEQPAQTPAST
jgi:hypothetical protein